MSSASLAFYRRPARLSAPWFLLLPALFTALIICLPLLYLFLRALHAQPDVIIEMLVRSRTLLLLANTLGLAGGVLLVTTIIALPLAWITARGNIPCKNAITVMGALPLAIPGYVMAYALIGIGGHYGLGTRMLGFYVPRPEGYWGALLALSLYTYPYLFLNLRTAFSELDPRHENTARSLGLSEFKVFTRVTLPHLRPALLSGWLVIALYVLGDFGTVALMRYDVLSYALYTQYIGAFDRTYTAWLGLMLLALAVCFIVCEHYALGTRQKAPPALGAKPPSRSRPLHPIAFVFSVIFIGILFFSALGLPILSLAYWLVQVPAGFDYANLFYSLMRSLGAAIPAAVICICMTLPVMLLRIRYESALSKFTERVLYLGYAVPPLALALAFVFFSLNVIPALYQSVWVLILAYGVGFAALASGPLRTAILQASSRHEEAARTLGRTPRQAFISVTLPALRRGAVTSFILVFLVVMKELPITFLLAPTGYSTLALGMFSHTNEGLLAQAAPFACAILLFSGLSVVILLRSLREAVSTNGKI